MTYEIRAKPTVYKGYRFRSRLEARWAVFLDKLKFRWEYEPETYATEHGPVCPDFVFGRRGETWYAEVKPNREHLDANLDHILNRYNSLVLDCSATLDLHERVGWVMLIGDPLDSLASGSSIASYIYSGGYREDGPSRLHEHLACPAYFVSIRYSHIALTPRKDEVGEDEWEAATLARQYDFMQYLSN